MIGERAPRLPHLRRLYDEGVEAARQGVKRNVYEPAEKSGDLTRAHFWRLGCEDAREDVDIETLI